MEYMSEILNAMMNAEFTTPVFIVAIIIVNNILMFRFMSKKHDAEVTNLVEHGRHERARATETINALRGIIYAFSDAQKQEQEEQGPNLGPLDPRTRRV